MQGRVFSGGSYRFGFNNQEKDSELGDAYAFEYRIHDARLGRFLSVDPLFLDYFWQSPFGFCANRPIDGRDLEGLEWSQSTTAYANGWKTVEFTVKIKVVVSSTIMTTETAKAQFAAAAKDAAAVFNKVDSENKVDYSMKIEYEFVSEKPKSGIIVELNDATTRDDPENLGRKIYTGGETVRGNTNNNTISLAAAVDGKQKTLKGSTLAHELGHQAGLGHPDLGEADAQTNLAYANGKINDNVMVSGTKFIDNNEGGGSGVTGKQLSIMSATVTENNPVIKTVKKCPENINSQNQYTSNPVPVVYAPCKETVTYSENPNDSKKTSSASYKADGNKINVSNVK